MKECFKSPPIAVFPILVRGKFIAFLLLRSKSRSHPWILSFSISSLSILQQILYVLPNIFYYCSPDTRLCPKRTLFLPALPCCFFSFFSRVFYQHHSSRKPFKTQVKPCPAQNPPLAFHFTPGESSDPYNSLRAVCDLLSNFIGLISSDSLLSPLSQPLGLRCSSQTHQACTCLSTFELMVPSPWNTCISVIPMANSFIPSVLCSEL